ncbi:MAG: hypothetical protein KF889_01705 [Alphaproteobacteria bacterium]|nr:hypothetical protein [Alphaproteobacteria bacterium]MCW5741623.1 hypothetical protein [Alphaproteobacteria bacterium]
MTSPANQLRVAWEALKTAREFHAAYQRERIVVTPDDYVTTQLSLAANTANEARQSDATASIIAPDGTTVTADYLFAEILEAEAEVHTYNYIFRQEYGKESRGYAEANLETVLKLMRYRPNDVHVYQRLVMAYDYLGDKKAYAKTLTDALELFPDDLLLNQWLAESKMPKPRKKFLGIF